MSIHKDFISVSTMKKEFWTPQSKWKWAGYSLQNRLDVWKKSIYKGSTGKRWEGGLGRAETGVELLSMGF